MKRNDDPEAEASVYINLANVLEAKGELKRAEDFYRRAIEVARQVDSKNLLASVLHLT